MIAEFKRRMLTVAGCSFYALTPSEACIQNKYNAHLGQAKYTLGSRGGMNNKKTPWYKSISSRGGTRGQFLRADAFIIHVGHILPLSN